MTFTESEKILFYSETLKRMTVKRSFKRPLKVFSKKSGLCTRCGNPSTITTHNPERKPFLDINRSICSLGHVEVSFNSRLNYQKSRFRS